MLSYQSSMTCGRCHGVVAPLSQRKRSVTPGSKKNTCRFFYWSILLSATTIIENFIDWIQSEISPRAVWGRSSWVRCQWFLRILKSHFRLSLSELVNVSTRHGHTVPNLEGMHWQKCIMTKNWTNARSRNIVTHILFKLPVSILHGTILEALWPGLGLPGSLVKAASRGS